MQTSQLVGSLFLLSFLFMMEFSDFSILVWNIRGAVSGRGRPHTKDLIRKYKPSMFVLLETHAQFEGARVFWRRLG